MNQINNFINQHENFFHNDFCKYNLGADISDESFIEKYMEFYIENGSSPRISAFFDPEYYLYKNPDVKDFGMEPLLHFIEFGFNEKRSPHPLIDLHLIESELSKENYTFANFTRYLNENRIPSAYFNSEFYLNSYKDVATSEIPALLHYIMSGGNECRLPNSFFNYEIYSRNCGKNLKGLALFLDFVNRGDSLNIEFSTRFDYEFYNNQFEEKLESEPHLFRHFIIEGEKLGYEPCEKLKLEGKSLISSAELYYDLKSRVDNNELKKKAVPQNDINLENLDSEEKIKKIVAKLKRLKIPKKVDVSILIPVFNAKKELFECLASILNSDYRNYTFEIIIADDFSTDTSISRVLNNVKGIKYLRNKENMGFLLNVNKAVDYCAGKYLFLLNSDVQVNSNCIHKLIDELKKDQGAVITGPKILFPNGVLQEAGGSATSTLQTQMVGSGEDPNDKKFSFNRYVDYISGAAICIKLEDFKNIGKFDEKLQPAYCEDLDLCLSFNKLNKKTLFVHDAIAYHHLSVSMNQVSSTYKYLQTAKNKKFLKRKHSEYLEKKRPKVIAFYLPQYHESKRNNLWWGKGFTEWTGAVSAKQNYDGHFQPHISTELGFYNLTDPRSHLLQEKMAKENGVHAFCFYYYNFGSDNEILQRALECFLESGSSMPFSLCWANENWTRTWDGNEKSVLLKQEANTDEEFLKILKKMERFIVADNYLKVDNKPFISIYRGSQFTNLKSKLNLWRSYWKEKYNQELHLVLVDSMERAPFGESPENFDADAAIEFPPHGIASRTVLDEDKILNTEFSGTVIDYQDAVEEVLNRPHPGYLRYPSVFPSWDNTPRRQDSGTIFMNSHPNAFQVYMERKVAEATMYNDDEKLLFVNAWNEWGEGAHLEPDNKYGRTFLQVISSVLKRY